MGITKITRNFQVTIPRYIRELVKLREGDRVLFTVDGDKLSLTKADNNIIENTSGIWNTKENGAEYQRRMRSEWKKRKNRLTS